MKSGSLIDKLADLESPPRMRGRGLKSFIIKLVFLKTMSPPRMRGRGLKFLDVAAGDWSSGRPLA